MSAPGGLPTNPLIAVLYGPWLIACLLGFLGLVAVASRVSWRMREQRRRVTRYTDRGPVAPLAPHQLCTRWLCYDSPDRKPCPGIWRQP